MSPTMNTKINKMDNTMTAVVSVVMIALGFVNGLIVSDLLNSFYMDKLHRALDKATDTMFEKDQEIDEVKELNQDLIRKLDFEKQRNLDILESVRNVAEEYDEHLPHVIDGPPRGPLKRSRACMESDSESEFECPISPEPVSSNKD